MITPESIKDKEGLKTLFNLYDPRLLSAIFEHQLKSGAPVYYSELNKTTVQNFPYYSKWNSKEKIQLEFKHIGSFSTANNYIHKHLNPKLDTVIKDQIKIKSKSIKYPVIQNLITSYNSTEL